MPKPLQGPGHLPAVMPWAIHEHLVDIHEHLVDKAHQRQRLFFLRNRNVVTGGTADRQQATLSRNRQAWVSRFD